VSGEAGARIERASPMQAVPCHGNDS